MGWVCIQYNLKCFNCVFLVGLISEKPKIHQTVFCQGVGQFQGSRDFRPILVIFGYFQPYLSLIQNFLAKTTKRCYEWFQQLQNMILMPHNYHYQRKNIPGLDLGPLRPDDLLFRGIWGFGGIWPPDRIFCQISLRINCSHLGI